MRLCKEWEIYADDCTIRTGRIIDGTYFSDKEYESRVKTAVKEAKPPQQDFEAAFEALGFNTKGLNADKRLVPKKERNAKGLGKEVSGDPSPYAQILSTVGLCVLIIGQLTGMIISLVVN